MQRATRRPIPWFNVLALCVLLLGLAPTPARAQSRLSGGLGDPPGYPPTVAMVRRAGARSLSGGAPLAGRDPDRLVLPAWWLAATAQGEERLATAVQGIGAAGVLGAGEILEPRPAAPVTGLGAPLLQSGTVLTVCASGCDHDTVQRCGAGVSTHHSSSASQEHTQSVRLPS